MQRNAGSDVPLTMTYRDDLAALSARHAALETELAQKTRELDQASRLLDEARARTQLPVLANIKVASPCTAEWAAMTGDERTRHCGECKKSVYNLSELTRDEAEALILEKEGRLCVRYYQRTDGTILLKDCTIGVTRRRRRRVIAAGAAALLAGGAAAGYNLMHRGETAVMGDMAFEEAPSEKTEYRVVQGVEPPPDEVVIEVKPRQPSIDDLVIHEVTMGAMVMTHDEPIAPLPAPPELPSPPVTVEQ
jgi:hypothetical protein